MIIKFKLFENLTEDDLVSQFSDNYINNYFDKNYEQSIEDIWTFVNIWSYIDDDKFVRDWIDNDVSNTRMSDLDKYDYAEYIKKLKNNDKVQKIVRKKAKRSKKYNVEMNYDFYGLVDLLSTKILQKIILKFKTEEDFLRDFYENRYDGYDAKSILEEIYGMDELEKNGLQYLEYYIDEDEIVRDYNNNLDIGYKKDCIASDIPYHPELQKKLLKINTENVISLFYLINNETGTLRHFRSIGDTYKFQNTFMKEIIKDNPDELHVAKKLKELNDKFPLTQGIKEKYKEYTFFIDTEKYNL